MKATCSLPKYTWFKKFCRAQTDLSVEDLPSALLKPTFCDTCAKKGKPHKTANVYCVVCDMKYCADHREVNRFWHPRIKWDMNHCI